MSKRVAARVSMAVIAAMLLTLLAAVPAFAAEAQPQSAPTAAAASATAGAEGAAAETGGAAEKKEIPHVVGKPSAEQLQELRNAWAGIPGYDLLVVSILGMLVTVGIIGFAAFKQARI